MAGEETDDRSRDRDTTDTLVHDSGQHSLLVRALWYLFIGWWASGTWLGIAWLLNLTVIGLPLGIKMINLVPTVLSLRRQRTTTIIDRDGDDIDHTVTGPDQYNLLVRAAYFLLIGWWASAIWMFVAWIASLTIIGLPVAIWMYNRLPYLTSLYRFR